MRIDPATPPAASSVDRGGNPSASRRSAETGGPGSSASQRPSAEESRAPKNSASSPPSPAAAALAASDDTWKRVSQAPPWARIIRSDIRACCQLWRAGATGRGKGGRSLRRLGRGRRSWPGYRPGVAGRQELLERGGPGTRLALEAVDLLDDAGLVARPLHRAQHAQGGREVGGQQLGGQEGERRAGDLLVPHPALLATVRSLGADIEGLEPNAPQPQPAAAPLAEDERLAVLELHRLLVAGLLLGHVAESLVVEDVAVLVDLDEGGAAVPRGAAQGLLQMLLEDVDAARDEGRAGAQGQRQGIERHVDRAEGGGLGALARLAGRRVLALGEAVDPVVEHQDLHPDVAAQDVDQVVAADRHRVAVAGSDPHLELRARQLEARRHGGGAAGGRGEGERALLVTGGGRGA